MPLVATLVASPLRPGVTGPVVAAARDALGAASEFRRLDGEVAADLVFVSGDGAAAVQTRLREAIGVAPVDVVVQDQARRRKRLFVADMDSTMIGQECIDELADYVGLRAEVSAITERAMRGEIAFEPALRERVALLRGLDAGIVDEIIRERIRPTPGGAEFLARFRASGGFSALVSGGFTLFTRRIAAMLGFSEDQANILEVGGDGRLTGTVVEPILGREAKRAALAAFRSRLGLESHETLAIGDGANGLAMLAEAGLGLAFRAKPAVAAAAHARLDHADLSALIHIAGLGDT